MTNQVNRRYLEVARQTQTELRENLVNVFTPAYGPKAGATVDQMAAWIGRTIPDPANEPQHRSEPHCQEP